MGVLSTYGSVQDKSGAQISFPSLGFFPLSHGCPLALHLVFFKAEFYHIQKMETPCPRGFQRPPCTRDSKCEFVYSPRSESSLYQTETGYRGSICMLTGSLHQLRSDSLRDIYN